MSYEYDAGPFDAEMVAVHTIACPTTAIEADELDEIDWPEGVPALQILLAAGDLDDPAPDEFALFLRVEQAAYLIACIEASAELEGLSAALTAQIDQMRARVREQRAGESAAPPG